MNNIWIKGNQGCVNTESVLWFIFSMSLGEGQWTVYAILKYEFKEIVVCNGFDTQQEASKWLYDQMTSYG